MLTLKDNTQDKIKSKEQFETFLSGHCCWCQYMISVVWTIRWYGMWISSIVSSGIPALHHLPDPVPHGEHYKSFDNLYGKETTEEYRPSLKEAQEKSHHGDHSMQQMWLTKSRLFQEENRSKEKTHNWKGIGRSSLYLRVVIWYNWGLQKLISELDPHQKKHQLSLPNRNTWQCKIQ